MRLSIWPGVSDVWSALRHPRLWMTLGIRSVRNSYRRTLLGPWWHSIDQLLFTLGFGFINSWLFGSDLRNSVNYVGLGILGFNQISLALLLGSQSLVASAQLRYAQVPVASRMFKMQVESLVVFVHRFLPMLAILLMTGHASQINVLKFLLGISLITSWGFAISLVLGPIGARFRDIQPLMVLLLRLALFATPIFWSPGNGANSSALNQLANWNPFSLLLETIRSPLLGTDIPASHMVTVCAIVIATNMIGLLVFATSYRHIQYWI